jgi:hypothetical protein
MGKLQKESKYKPLQYSLNSSLQYFAISITHYLKLQGSIKAAFDTITCPTLNNGVVSSIPIWRWTAQSSALLVKMLTA